MPNDSARDMPIMMPGLSNRWRQVLGIALLVGSVAATLLAVTLVIALFWWTSTLSAGKPERTATSRQPPPAAVPVSKPALAAGAAVSKPAAAAPRAPAPAAHVNRPSVGAAPGPEAAAAQAAPPQVSAPPRHQREPDAAKNRQLASDLARLADDPEGLRKLGLPQPQPQQ